VRDVEVSVGPFDGPSLRDAHSIRKRFGVAVVAIRVPTAPWPSTRRPTPCGGPATVSILGLPAQIDLLVAATRGAGPAIPPPTSCARAT